MIALTVDSEQWNCPLLEGNNTVENDNTSYSREGNEILMDMFKKHGVKSTFFTTGFFGECEPEQVKRLHDQGHEIAGHGYHHFWRGNRNLDIRQEVTRTKQVLEKITGSKMKGFRAPQLQYSSALVAALGQEDFCYDSSLNPVFMPGAYNNLAMPKSIFRPTEDNPLVEIPLAVGALRQPAGWVFMRLLGINRTIRIIESYLRRGMPAVLYVHSWELIRITSRHVPFYYRYRTGAPFAADIEFLIRRFGGDRFTTMDQLAEAFPKTGG